MCTRMRMSMRVSTYGWRFEPGAWLQRTVLGHEKRMGGMDMGTGVSTNMACRRAGVVHANASGYAHRHVQRVCVHARVPTRVQAWMQTLSFQSVVRENVKRGS